MCMLVQIIKYIIIIHFKGSERYIYIIFVLDFIRALKPYKSIYKYIHKYFKTKGEEEQG